MDTKNLGGEIMTAKELIEQLKQYPDNTRIFCRFDGDDVEEGFLEVTELILIKPNEIKLGIKNRSNDSMLFIEC
jgi:hypothetical protein